MNLKKQIINGLAWNMISSFITQFINFGTKIIIARILFPADFGLFAMAIVLINFLSIFTGFGIVSALIYKQEETEKTLNTAFMLSIILGITISIISFFSSGFVASFFAEPALKKMIQVLSCVFLFDSVSSIFNGYLAKNLEFKRKTVAELVSVFCFSLVVIFLALSGKGVWSIIIAYVAQHFVLMILLYLISPIKPTFLFDKKVAEELLHFGKYVLSTTLLAWAITSVDNILVGKKLGDESLGYYSMAFNIAALPVLSVTGMLTTVFHPIYAKLQDDKERLKRAYLKPLVLSLVLMLPIAGGMLVLADILVFILLGQKWMIMVPIIRVFSFYCIFRTVCTIISQLLEGSGKPRIASMLLGIEVIILFLCLIPAIHYLGIFGAAIAVVFARGLSMFLHLWQIKKIMSITWITYGELLWKKVFATICMSIGVYVIRSILVQNTIMNFIALVGLGIIIYVCILFLLEKQMFKELYDHLLFI